MPKKITYFKNKIRVLLDKADDFLFEAVNVDFSEIVCWLVGHKSGREVACQFLHCPCLNGAVQCERCGRYFRDGKKVSPGITRIF